MKSERWKELLLSLIFFVLTACSSIIPQAPTKLPINTVVLRKEVVQFTDADRAQIQSVGVDRLVLTGAPRFVVGSLLVNEVGQPFLRRVTKVNQSGSTFIVQTEQASLSEISDNGMINVSIPVELKSISSRSLQSQGFSIDGNRLCLTSGSKFYVEGCLSIEIALKIEGDFLKKEFKIYDQFSMTGEVTPGVKWKLNEALQEEFSIPLTAKKALQEINIFGGGKLKIPIEIGPNLYFKLSSEASTSSNLSEINLSLFTLKPKLSGELGIELKNSSSVKTVAEFDKTLEIKGPAVDFSGQSRTNAKAKKLAQIALGLGYYVGIFDQKSFEVALEPRINSSFDFDFQSFRLDYKPIASLWYGIKGELNLKLWIVNFNASAELGNEYPISSWCGSIPADGRVVITPSTSSLQINQSRDFTAQIQGYPYLLSSNCGELNSVWTTTGGILSPNDNPNRVSFRSSTPGSFTVSASNPLDPSKKATAIVAVLSGPQGELGGLVRDAVSKVPVSGASVVLSRGSGEQVASSLTGTDGTYTLQAPAGTDYIVRVSRTGYQTALVSSVEVVVSQSRFFETLLFIDSTRVGNGGISGKITNSVTGGGVPSATLQLRANLNTRSGLVSYSSSTDANGQYSFATVPAGYYTAEVGRGGFVTNYFNVVSVGGLTTPNQNFSISPALLAEQLRVVLTWGQNPSDLDSHLTGPDAAGGRFHLFYVDKGQTFTYGATQVILDVDDISSYGPETINLTRAGTGLYRYSVHDYSNKDRLTSTDLSNSDARVLVYSGNNSAPILDLKVPVGRSGNLWTVFEIENNTLRLVNTVNTVDNSLSVQSLGNNDSSVLLNLPSK